MTYVRRKIDVTFQLADGKTFDGSEGGDTVTISGLRVQASIQKFGGDGMGHASLRIYGMSLSLMNQLSTMGRLISVGPIGAVSVSAGDEDGAMAVVFQGSIQAAYADLNGAPDGVFVVDSLTGVQEALRPLEPISIRGPVDVATVVAGLAGKMRLVFENSGVQAVLPTCYYPGTGREQLMAITRDANVNCIIDSGVLAIWPAGAERKGLIPLISKETGMVGYPAYADNAIIITTLFNPSINFGMNVQVQSDLEKANGIWNVYSVQLELESETPGGQWFTQFKGGILGFVPIK